jgi:hypothetical protein
LKSNSTFLYLFSPAELDDTKIATYAGLEAYMKELDSPFEEIILPFIPGEIQSADPSSN